MDFIQAAHYTSGRLKTPRLIVVHDMEAPDKASTAESVARYFASPDSRQASAHFCVDPDSVVQCVRLRDTAWAAAGANADGIHVEHAGYARSSRAQWLSDDRATLELGARLVATLCRAYNIPSTRLTVAQVADGKTRGICGHGDVSAAFPKVSTGHTDPGGQFPWDVYQQLVHSAASLQVQFR